MANRVYFGAPPNRKCSCGRVATVVEPPSMFKPLATLLCTECSDSNVETKTMIYDGEVPLSIYERAYQIGTEVANKMNQAVCNAITLRENPDA